MQNPIKIFEPNLKGRDFVIGDLHGSYDIFLNLLDNLKFDGEVDRMFSVGDLVDRGPDSLNCLRLLKEPWFHCVLANHEQMMLEAFWGGYMGQFWIQNGGSWGIDYLTNFKNSKNTNDDTKEVLELLDIVRELPFLITVKMKDNSKIHIIHAELPPGHIITDSELSSPGKVVELATVQSGDGDYFVWGRYKFYNFYATDLNNRSKCIRIVKNIYPNHKVNNQLSRIISGHTIVQKPLTILGQTDIDTKAYGSFANQYGSAKGWCGLTCVELNEWKFTKTTSTEHQSVNPMVINTSDLNSFDEDNNGY